MGVVILLVAALGPLWPAAASAKTGPGKRAQRLTKKATKDLNQVLAEVREQLHLFGNKPSVQEDDEVACNADASAAVAELPQYAALGAARLSGELYCLSEQFTPPVNLSDRPWLLRAASSNSGFGVGDYERVTPWGEPSLGVGRVFLLIDFFDAEGGIVVGPVSVDWLNTHVAETRPKRALDVLVIDSHGTVLARAGIQPTQPGENLANSSLVEAMLKNHRGAGRFRVGGEKARSAFRTVPVSEGAVHVAVSVRR